VGSDRLLIGIFGQIIGRTGDSSMVM